MTTPQPIGTPDWGTHTALIRQSTVSFNTAVRIGPGATQTLFVTLTQTGYQVYINAFDFSGANSLPLTFTVTWLDSAQPNTIGRQKWSFYAGAAANPHTVLGHGPCESGTMRIDMTNHHGVDTASVTIDVSDVSQPYQRHDWRTDDFGVTAFPGFSLVSSDLNGGYLAIASASIPANTVETFLMPLYSGWAVFACNEAPTQGCNYNIVSEAEQAIAPGFIQNMQAILSAGQYWQSQPVCLPRAQCALQINNYSASATTANVSLIISGT